MDVFTNYYRLHKDPGVKRRNLLKYLLSFIDLLAIILAFQTAYLINYYEKGNLFYEEKNVLVLFIAVLPFWLLILYLIRSTGIPTKRYKVLFLLYFQSSTAIFLLLILFYFFFRLNPFSGLFLLELPFCGFIYLYFGRILIYYFLARFGKKAHNHVVAIIIADHSSIPFIDNLLSDIKLGYKAVVIFTESSAVKSRYENDSIILPEKFSGIIGDLIEVDFVDEVLYLKEHHDAKTIREILATCEDLGVTFRLKSSLPKPSLSSGIKTNIADRKFLSFINIPNNSYALAFRKTTDINIALLLIVVLSPLFVLLGILVKMTSRGHVISKVSKIGWRGRQIKAYRFRTMYSDAAKKSFYSESNSSDRWFPPEDDPRVTKFGKFLMKSGLDQLPQLFNVLKGEISIIAPQHPLQNDNVKSHNRKYS
jgi:lipopolysaccharide/colanic/teichoic acid biosynthesis glycosyltransferase